MGFLNIPINVTTMALQSVDHVHRDNRAGPTVFRLGRRLFWAGSFAGIFCCIKKINETDERFAIVKKIDS